MHRTVERKQGHGWSWGWELGSGRRARGPPMTKTVPSLSEDVKTCKSKNICGGEDAERCGSQNLELRLLRPKPALLLGLSRFQDTI